MKRLIFFLAFFLMFSAFAVAKEAVYKTYYGFLPIGEVTFKWDKNYIEIKGSVYPYLKFVYDYNFEFKAVDNDFYLYEKENKKVREFKKEEIYKKKPWLPLLVKFLKTKKADETSPLYPYKLKIEGKKYTIYPLKSKKVSKIVVIFDGDEIFPKEIRIYGKHYIKLKRKQVKT